MWFRRDLRLADHPALLAACDETAAADPGVLALFVLDDTLRGPAGAARLAFLYRCLRELDERIGGRLCVRTGDPVEVVPAVAREIGAGTVHCSTDHGPYGTRRDRRVAEALARDGRELRPLGSPYAVAPGRLHTAGGTPFRVYTPYYRAWYAHGVRKPPAAPREVRWARADGDPVPPDPALPAGLTLPTAGEEAAGARFAQFLDADAARYATRRDEPGADATSRLSPYLKYGCVHPRTLLARLGRGEGHERFRMELAWRDFYADVLAANPDSARADLTPALGGMEYDEPGPDAQAWRDGRTGFPIVDAGMRQLLAEGWLHNRVRMIVASFLCKDLHVWWGHGARWFLRTLVDGDLASNNHGWQWVAGTGTDAAPYFRVFNPVAQGRSHDPDGTYVRRWVPELADVTGRAVHEPWTLPDGPPNGYPRPIVGHAQERREALRRYGTARVRAAR